MNRIEDLRVCSLRFRNLSRWKKSLPWLVRAIVKDVSFESENKMLFILRSTFISFYHHLSETYKVLLLRSFSTDWFNTTNHSVMPAIDFYHIPASAPCRAVQMLARELKIDLICKLVNLLTGEQYKPEYMKVRKLWKVQMIRISSRVKWSDRWKQTKLFTDQLTFLFSLTLIHSLISLIQLILFQLLLKKMVSFSTSRER